MEVTAGRDRRRRPLAPRQPGRRPRTEVGRLGLALNAMLDRLEQAFAERQASEDRLRQFLADASHELRTPLASIRGYAELFRMGATASRGDTEIAMRRIEEESERMGVLVEDLLTLARLDEAPELSAPSRSTSPSSPRDAVTDARATAPERAISVDARRSAAVVSGDPHQLHQVLANLHAQRARAHARRHRRSRSRSRRTASERHGAACATTGRACPPDAHEHLFDRFWRAEGGRERGRAGAGLGPRDRARDRERPPRARRRENAPGGGGAVRGQPPGPARDPPPRPGS